MIFEVDVDADGDEVDSYSDEVDGDEVDGDEVDDAALAVAISGEP